MVREISHKARHDQRQGRALIELARASKVPLDALRARLDAQRWRCPICAQELPIVVRLDYDSAGVLRGLVCKPCLNFIHKVEGDPLRAPQPNRRPYRKVNALRYLHGMALSE